MIIRLITEYELEDETDEDLQTASLDGIAAIQRLYGEGFLRDDIVISGWRVRSELIDGTLEG